VMSTRIISSGTPAILNFAISLGLDAIVEVVNMKELQEVAPLGLPIYGFNLSVGLALSLPGIRQDISKSLIGEIPFGASSVVGVYSIEEARAMKAAGADAVYIKHEVLQGQQATEKEPKVFLENLQVAMSGDD
jgi:indole-3-glycerol phosphate synthase